MTIIPGRLDPYETTNAYRIQLPITGAAADGELVNNYLKPTLKSKFLPNVTYTLKGWYKINALPNLEFYGDGILPLLWLNVSYDLDEDVDISFGYNVSSADEIGIWREFETQYSTGDIPHLGVYQNPPHFIKMFLGKMTSNDEPEIAAGLDVELYNLQLVGDVETDIYYQNAKDFYFSLNNDKKPFLGSFVFNENQGGEDLWEDSEISPAVYFNDPDDVDIDGWRKRTSSRF